MPFKSQFSDLDIPKINVLSHLFPPGSTPSDIPIWIDANDPKLSLSRKQLLAWVKRLAVGVSRFSEPNQPCMIFTPNHIFVPVAFLAIVGSGRSFSAANPAYTLPELVHQLKNTEAQIILAHPDLVGIALAAAKEAGLPNGRVFQFSDIEQPPLDGVLDWRAMIGTPEEGDQYTWENLKDEESERTVATINYSSGTTGLPKGVCVSHYNLIANLEQVAFIRHRFRPWPTNERPPERWIGFLPLYHTYGQLFNILIAMKLGIPVYVMKQFVYEEFLRIIQDHKITALQVAPPIMVMLDKRPETSRYDLSSLESIMCGAAPLSRELQNNVARKFNVQIDQGWGMTEVTAGAIHVPAGVSDDTGSCGMLDPNCESKLLDDDGKEVAEGERGELYIRGPNVCMGYWKNDQATQESITVDKWLKTGDIAVIRNHWYWIVDRKKELIKVNALQVAPAELEAVLLENDDVADSAVVGITLHDEEWPRAYVTLKDGAKGRVSEKDIQEWIKSRVAKHKWLVGGVTFIDEVPKSPSGKILRKIMREWAKRDAPKIESVVKARL